MKRKYGKAIGLAAVLLSLGGQGKAAPPVPYATIFAPGTRDELPYLSKVAGAAATEGQRHADIGQFWFYAFPTAAGASCRLVLTLDGDILSPLPNVTVLDADSKPVPIHLIRESDAGLSILWTTPAKWKPGARIAIVLSAKDAPFTVKNVQFAQTVPDSNGDGLPDVVGALMRQSLGRYPLEVSRPPAAPFTIMQTGSAPNTGIDLQTDAVFAYTGESAKIAGWKLRGYTTWTMGGSRAGKDYADAHPGELQTGSDGVPLTVEGSYYLNPTANRIGIEQDYYAQALAGGSEGICPEEPEYWFRAGYEDAFKSAWQAEYGAAWQRPDSSLDARWKASRLMAKLETEHIAALLDHAAQVRPNARRLVALHSPLNYAQWGIVCPQYRIAGLPSVQDIIGQVWTGTARTPVRYLGAREDRAFSLAYLEYSSLYQLTRGTKKKLWFLADPLEDDPNRAQTDYKAHYEQTLIAALLFPDVTAYEVMPWPDRVYGHVPPEYATEINSVVAAMQEMHSQTGTSGNAATANIGVFVSDTLQWQGADMDGVFGLALPLLQRGVPVQMLSLERAADANYLKSFKTLLLSYDFQKPLDSRIQSALSDWMRRGGSLIFFGGSDAFNAVPDAWWRKAGQAAPQDALFTSLGLKVDAAGGTMLCAEPENTTRYTLLMSGDGKEHNLANRSVYRFDLTKFGKETGSVAVRFSDVSPSDGWGAWVAGAELRVGGQVAAAFRVGSDIENRFVAFDNGSQISGEARFADGTASWTYQFDNLPKDQPIILTVDMGNGFSIAAASAVPDTSRTLLGTGAAAALTNTFPRLRIGRGYPITIYPNLIAPVTPTVSEKHSGGPRIELIRREKEEPVALYTLRSGGVPMWTVPVEKGMLLNVGVAPGFFSESERSAGMLRVLTQYAMQRAGSAYREGGGLRLKRGKFTVVSTFGQSVTVPGRTIDVLSPDLRPAADREIPPRSLALLVDFPQDEIPRIGWVSGRVQARIETPLATRFFVRGPAGTTGAARLAANGRKMQGVRATDWIGRPVAVQETVQGDTVLLRFPHHPDGVILYVGWK